MIGHRFNAFLLLVMLIAASCSGPTPASEETETASAPARMVLGGEGEHANVLYSMPTPNELFELIDEMHTAVDKDALYEVSLATSTDDRLELAYRFGICATDLVYASYFDLGSEVVRYYLTTKSLSKEIGLEEAFNKVDVRSLERNLSRGDSLTILTNDAYLTAYQKLQDENQIDILSMVLAGAWVETTHLLIEQIGEFDSANELVDRLAEQQFGLGQVIDLMYSTEGELSDMVDRLLAVQEVFDQMEANETGGPIEQNNGRHTLGGEQSFEMDPVKFGELKSAITNLRGGVRHNF